MRKSTYSLHTHNSDTHVDVGIEELRSGVAREHVDDDHLTPLLHIDQQVTQLTVVLVDEIDSVRTHFFECHHYTASHKLDTRKDTHFRCEITLGTNVISHGPVTHCGFISQ